MKIIPFLVIILILLAGCSESYEKRIERVCEKLDYEDCSYQQCVKENSIGTTSYEQSLTNYYLCELRNCEARQ